MYVDEFNTHYLLPLKSYKKIGHSYKNKNMTYHTSTREGFVCYMCPECFHLELAKIDLTLSCNLSFISHTDNKSHVFCSYDLTMKCLNCEKIIDNWIELDPNIASSIISLNRKGYLTKYSCEGHGKGLGYISFLNFYDIQPYLHTLPITWYVDLEDYRQGKLIIRSDKENYREAIIELEEWVNTLPIQYH